LTAVVVLPTPPFWLAMVITRQDGGRGHSRSVSPSAASAAWAGLTAVVLAGLTGAAGAGPGLTACPCAGTVTGGRGDPGTAAIATPPPCPPPAPVWGETPPPGAGAAETAAAAGFPRVLTVPLPCASSGTLTFRASVSRETADNACFTRAGGSSRTAACDACAGSCGHPRPTATSRDSSRARPDEGPAASSGHPTASGEAITALLPGQSHRRQATRLLPGSVRPTLRTGPAGVTDQRSAGRLWQPDRPYRPRPREPPPLAHPTGAVPRSRPRPPPRPGLLSPPARSRPV